MDMLRRVQGDNELQTQQPEKRPTAADRHPRNDVIDNSAPPSNRPTNLLVHSLRPQEPGQRPRKTTPSGDRNQMSEETSVQSNRQAQKNAQNASQTQVDRGTTSRNKPPETKSQSSASNQATKTNASNNISNNRSNSDHRNQRAQNKEVEARQQKYTKNRESSTAATKTRSSGTSNLQQPDSQTKISATQKPTVSRLRCDSHLPSNNSAL